MKSIYIDWANLHQWAKLWVHTLDYKKFIKRLHDKYSPKKVYLFIWYIKWKEPLYTKLSQLGYTLIFKETLVVWWKVKWNCDAELVVQAVSDRYEWSVQSVIVSGDWDFACLLDFFLDKGSKPIILAPNRKFCSFLLKKRNCKTVFLEEVSHKFANTNTKNPR